MLEQGFRSSFVYLFVFYVPKIYIERTFFSYPVSPRVAPPQENRTQQS